ncbi:hypothetical protein [Actinoplanes regularis]|uniref:4-hydroxybenzoate polyprenyltransferase n=1 Tax=Actinoplanes regularis TaxID=52697 RepID=A0A239F7B7_9ACTN|nr:hypothetical protein [Actinoplanes regularis]SNS51974.1 hypothetical protein SAMN06264365_11789 [Actinoplanes regularis]
MIGRWARFIAGSYPVLPSVLFAVAWAYGVTGLFAAVDPRAPHWTPGPGTAVAAATLAVDLLLMRALDDIRDLEYDRRFNPGRPLAAGAVRVRDLLVLYAAGTAGLLLLNAADPVAMTVLAVQLGYGALVLTLHHRAGWPSGDKLLLGLLVSFPAQLFLHVYLYAGYLHATWLGPHPSAAVAIGVVVLAGVHLELARKITRAPRPGERTYVSVFGLTATMAVALTAPVLSAALLLAWAGPPGRIVLPAVVVPLVLPMFAAWRFNRTESSRWPAAEPALYLLLTFAGYFLLGLQPS